MQVTHELVWSALPLDPLVTDNGVACHGHSHAIKSESLNNLRFLSGLPDLALKLCAHDMGTWLLHTEAKRQHLDPLRQECGSHA